MIGIEEIGPKELPAFWDAHIRYLIDDGIISDGDDVEYFSGDEYRGIIEAHMQRDRDTHHIVYFRENGTRIGAASYCTYESEGGKCFILDFWVFPAFRGNGTGAAALPRWSAIRKRTARTVMRSTAKSRNPCGSGNRSASRKTASTNTACRCLSVGNRRFV